MTASTFLTKCSASMSDSVAQNKQSAAPSSSEKEMPARPSGTLCSALVLDQGFKIVSDPGGPANFAVCALAAKALVEIPQALRRWGGLFELELQRGNHARLRNRNGRLGR
jgi:hypothetical protein